MPRNEQQTRFELIDPMLLDHRGWRREDICVEETAAPVDIVYGKGQRRPKGRTDYVLRYALKLGTEPIPLAILEAKHEDLPPGHGLQQGKGYRVGHLHHVPFVFSSNGHQFVEYNEATGIVSDPRPMSEFPTPQELVAHLLAATGLPPENRDWSLLLTPYAKGRDYLRYYQDAAIRATIEKTIRQRAAGEPPRVLLSLATGSGKTRVAAVLLRKMFDAGVMGRALFVCDRTELRDNGLGDFQAVFGNDAAEVDSRHPQKNARVLVATYQTLAQDMGPDGGAFFQTHYPADFFDVIVIDECHRSAWGDWRNILERHGKAAQIGLTATPCELRLPKVPEGELLDQIDSDARFLADNYHYFGDPAYEYTYLQGVADGYLAPNEIETYDLYQDGHREPERVHGVKRADVATKQLTDLYTGQAVPPAQVSEKNAPSTLESRLFEPERIKTMCAHYFDRLLATGENDPLQKSIIFCASDHHADLVANELSHFNVMHVDGRLTRVTPGEYRARLVQELTASVPSLADFRVRWLQPEARAAMLAELTERQLLPEKLREASNMDAYDLFDVLAALAYGIAPRTRAERAAQFSDSGPDWLIHLPPVSAKVLRAIVRQFERAGTDGLETNELWQTPDIRQLNGLKALREGGDPTELLRKLKETLFAA